MTQKIILKRAEVILITFMWLVIIAAPLLFQNNFDEMTKEEALRPLVMVIPLFILFLINRLILVPKLLFKKLTIQYIISVILLVALLTFGLFFSKSLKGPNPPMRDQFPMDQRRQAPPHIRGERKPPPPRKEHRQPLPAYANFLIFSFLLIGFDTGLRTSFQWLKSEKEKEELEKESTSHLLNMLRHQVSPHFFMNTLNNIHTLIDIDAEDAKDSVMKLSKMMRYLLYETANDKTTLRKEIGFIESYIELMKSRVSEKVDIQVNLPENVPERSLPPLLFTSFIENAFKHGISYQKSSFIHINLIADNDRLALQIKNSKGAKVETGEASGIGLENVKKRLELIYGQDYNLDIFDHNDDFSIHLSIPLSHD